MALPKLNTPTYELELPSTSKKIKYRPFLVKEQKILMMAQDSEDETEISEAVGSLVQSCTFGEIDPKTSPMFDIEFLFLKIRGKSVGDKIELNLICPDDGKTQVKKTIDLEDVGIHMLEDHTNEIAVSDECKIIFRYPILSDMKGVAVSDISSAFSVISSCISEIHYGDDIYNKNDISKKDIEEFIDSLTGEQFEKVTGFFQTMPKLRYVVEVINPKTEKKNEIVVEGLQSFLG
jgi:hypothetical protein|tara:strand:+ start:31 stop:732 length:702 start_codon:yes stop_codon:yes gene_type:complete